MVQARAPCALASTPHLRFLALQGNRLADLLGVNTLATLMFLDASDNAPLRHLDELVAALPPSLRFLKCGGCGAAGDATEYRQALVATLPALRTLDDVDVTRGERRAAREAFGEDPDDTEDEGEAVEEEEEGGGDPEGVGGGEEIEREEGGEGGVRLPGLEDTAARGMSRLDIDDDEDIRVGGEAGEAGAAAAAAVAIAAANKSRAAAAAGTANAAADGRLRSRPPSASASSGAVEMERRRLHSIIPTLTDPTMDSAVVVDALTVGGDVLFRSVL